MPDDSFNFPSYAELGDASKNLCVGHNAVSSWQEDAMAVPAVNGTQVVVVRNLCRVTDEMSQKRDTLGAGNEDTSAFRPGRKMWKLPLGREAMDATAVLRAHRTVRNESNGTLENDVARFEQPTLERPTSSTKFNRTNSTTNEANQEQEIAAPIKDSQSTRRCAGQKLAGQEDLT